VGTSGGKTYGEPLHDDDIEEVLLSLLLRTKSEGQIIDENKAQDIVRDSEAATFPVATLVEIMK
jgi:hypothetical protein